LSRAAIASIVAFTFVVAVFSFSAWLRTSRLDGKLDEIGHDLSRAEDRISALNSTITTLRAKTNLVGGNTSTYLAQIRADLQALNQSLGQIRHEIAELSQRAPSGLEGQVQALLNRTDRLASTTQSIQSNLRTLNDRIDALNRTSPAAGGDLLVALNTTVGKLASEVSDLGEVLGSLLNSTPAHIYEEVHKSVVLIRTNLGQGSGFFYGPDLILTNWHVVKGADRIEVEFYNRERGTAQLVGGDPYSDVALIRVASAPDITPLSLGNSSAVWIGQQVVAIGNPLGLSGSLSSGYVAQINKLLNLPPIIVPVLELDVTIAPGSSGGPLFDLSGDVIGITNAGTGYGINFAVPSNIVERAARSILQTGSYEHPYVGVSLVELSPESIRALNVINIDPFQTGLIVMGVSPGMPAEEAGLEPAVRTQDQSGSPAYEARDIILAVDGHPTLTFEDWAAYVEEKVSPGQVMSLKLWRSGTVTSVNVTATSRPPSQT